jgi:hypothetical protein
VEADFITISKTEGGWISVLISVRRKVYALERVCLFFMQAMHKVHKHIMEIMSVSYSGHLSFKLRERF